jgi:hypothetical protein
LLSYAVLSVGLLTAAAAPEGVAVLTLATRGEIPDAAVLKENFSVLVQADLAVAVTPGDALPALAMTLGCETADEACLAKVAEVLAVRFVLSADVGKERDGLAMRAQLFDAESKRVIATAEGALSSAGDRESISRLVRALLAVDAAAPLRRGEGGAAPGRARFALPAIFGAASVALGASFLVFQLNKNAIDFPGEGTVRGTLAIGADVFGIAAGATFILALARGKKAPEKQ